MSYSESLDKTITAYGKPCLNYYGQPIIAPEYYDEEHAVNPMGAGLPPVCSCGWTPHDQWTMADHLAQQKQVSQ